MKTVYIVLKASDVDRVFSNLENAKEYIQKDAERRWNGNTNCTIKDYLIDYNIDSRVLDDLK